MTTLRNTISERIMVALSMTLDRLGQVIKDKNDAYHKGLVPECTLGEEERKLEGLQSLLEQAYKIAETLKENK